MATLAQTTDTFLQSSESSPHTRAGTTNNVPHTLAGYKSAYACSSPSVAHAPWQCLWVCEFVNFCEFLYHAHTAMHNIRVNVCSCLSYTLFTLLAYLNYTRHCCLSCSSIALAVIPTLRAGLRYWGYWGDAFAGDYPSTLH